ncbi:MAG: putative membrane protein [Parvicellaceae bacterium]|jgi:putative membrane protein
MSYFNPQFEEKLTDAVQAIEGVSKVEVVVVVKEHSSNYQHVPVLMALFAFVLGFGYFMISPIMYGDAMILSGSIGTAIVFYGLGSIGSIKKTFVKRASLDRYVELNARAIFQKAGIHHTKDEIGILIYASKLEGKLMLLTDRGVIAEIHPDELTELEQTLQTSFNNGDADKFIHSLKDTAKLFGERLPVEENDVNELPDFLDIEI